MIPSQWILLANFCKQTLASRLTVLKQNSRRHAGMNKSLLHYYPTPVPEKEDNTGMKSTRTPNISSHNTWGPGSSSGVFGNSRKQDLGKDGIE